MKRPTNVEEIDETPALDQYRGLVSVHPGLRGFLTFKRKETDLKSLQSAWKKADEAGRADKDSVYEKYRSARDDFGKCFESARKRMGTPSNRRYDSFHMRSEDYAPRHFLESLDTVVRWAETSNADMVHHFIQRHEWLLDKTAAITLPSSEDPA